MGDIIGYIIQGFFQSIGTAIGSYLALKGVIHNIEKAYKKLTKKSKQ